jgi:glycylpeptide N-tetradecanoyltransferase
MPVGSASTLFNANMADESKVDDTANTQDAAAEVIAESKAAPSNPQVESDSDEDEDGDEAPAPDAAASGTAAAKKKKSKKKRIKSLLHGRSSEPSESSSRDEISKAVGGLNKSQLSQLLAMNPALAQQLGVADGDLSSKQATDALKKLSLEDIMTGLAANGKNAKDIGSYKFWQTQPVPKFGEKGEIEEGPFKIIALEDVPKEPGPLLDGFEWVTMDLNSDEELKEVFDLLYGHYVEDNESMFRFNYSKAFLKW